MKSTRYSPRASRAFIPTYKHRRQQHAGVRDHPLVIEHDARRVRQTVHHAGDPLTQDPQPLARPVLPAQGVIQDSAPDRPDARTVNQGFAAIIESFGRVETALRDLLAAAGLDVSQLSVPALVREALARDLISPETASAIEGITVLRNLAAHGRAGAVSHDRAVEYLALVDAVLYTLRRAT
jgi:hypothetical protein